MTEIEEKNVNENPIGFKYVEGPIVVYKSFDKDFCCHEKQYEVGKSYHADGDVKSLSEAFYGFIKSTEAIMTYDSYECTRFAVVELSGTVIKRDDNFYMASDMKIIREVDWSDLVMRISYALKSRKIELVTRRKYFFEPDHVIKDNEVTPFTYKDKKIYVDGKNSMLASMGGGCEVLYDEGSIVSGMGVSQKIASIAIEARIMTGGSCGNIESYGERGTLCNMGDYSKIFITGDFTYLVNSGLSCSIISTGKYNYISDCCYGTLVVSSGENATISVTGNETQVLSTGNNARIVVAGDDCYVTCCGKNTVISVIGEKCTVRAKDWTNVIFAGVKTDLEQLSEGTYKSVTYFAGNAPDSKTWRFMNDGKIEESKK